MVADGAAWARIGASSILCWGCGGWSAGEGEIVMKCPICKKEVKVGDPEMPFCSERCRLIDLGMWSAEEYRVPGPSVESARTQEEDDEE